MKKLLFIETDFRFIKNFENNLKKENLDKEFEVVMIMPDSSAKKVEELVIQSCIDQTLSFEKEEDNIYGIFVDICIIDGVSAPLGIQIAATLRQSFRQTPIFNITNKTKLDSDFDSLSLATLENIDGVLVKSFLEDDYFSKNRFDKIFLKANFKRAITLNESIEKHQKIDNSFDIAIITALIKPELEAVKKILKNLKPINKAAYSIKDTTIYSEAFLEGKSKDLKVVFASDDLMGMPAITSLATRIISSFKPKYIVILGIAAGIVGDNNIGDILVTEYSWDYGSGKRELVNKKEVFRPYINQLKIDEGLRKMLLEYKSNSVLLNEIREGYPQPEDNLLKLHIGPFSSGSAVIASDRFVDELKVEYKKLIGFDMEVYGVFCASESFPEDIKPKVLAIKSVADFGTSKKNNPLKKHHQAYAAYTSAEFFRRFAKNEL
jgi:nucleoside phosphorylase